MTRKVVDQKPGRKLEQALPTAARPVDAQGRELDEWGLPLNGPARGRALAKIGKPDPNDDRSAWTGPVGHIAVTETENG